MARSVGLPFFVVSATAPLLQRWYSLTTARDAGDPYHLYAASNLGSLAALLCYPSLIEPSLGLKAQATAWTGGFVALLAALAACAVTARRTVQVARPLKSLEAPASPVTWRRRATWVALAAVPSSLFLGLTTQISTDIASVPLLWILPLTIYLLTFVIAFARRPILTRGAVARTIPYVAAIAVLVQGFETSIGLPQIAIGAAILFLLALMCHSDLAASRPAPAHLTEFYLLMSLGGALGGAFNALLAPMIFSGVYEYPIALALALLLWAASRAEAWTLRGAVPRLVGATGVFLGLHTALHAASELGALHWMLGLKVAAALLCFALRARPLTMALVGDGGARGQQQRHAAAGTRALSQLLWGSSHRERLARHHPLSGARQYRSRRAVHRSRAAPHSADLLQPRRPRRSGADGAAPIRPPDAGRHHRAGCRRHGVPQRAG